MLMQQDFFALFGLPRAYALDGAALDAAYRALQARVHPDQFALHSDAERRVAMQWATHANEAYQTLKSPLQRGIYLLKLEGQDIEAENNTAMDKGFLIEQMEWREQVEDASAARNVNELDTLLKALRNDKKTRYAKFAGWLESRAWQPACEAARQLLFLEKVDSEIGDQLERLEA